MSTRDKLGIGLSIAAILVLGMVILGPVAVISIIFGIILLTAIAGLIFMFWLKDKEQQQKAWAWVVANSSSIIAIALVVSAILIIVNVFGIQKNAGFWLVIIGAIIWSLKKKKETNWGLIVTAIILLGWGYYAFSPSHPDEKPFSEATQQQGYVKTFWQRSSHLVWVPDPPMPEPCFQRVACREFIGKGFGDKKTLIWTGWTGPDISKTGDQVRYLIPGKEHLEIYNGEEWVKFQGPVIKVNVLADIGELNFKAPKGVEVYGELWGRR